MSGHEDAEEKIYWYVEATGEHARTVVTDNLSKLEGNIDELFHVKMPCKDSEPLQVWEVTKEFAHALLRDRARMNLNIRIFNRPERAPAMCEWKPPTSLVTGPQTNGAKKKRLQFDFTTTACQRLKRLRERSGAATNAEVVRKALALYEMAVECRLSGGKVVFKDDQGQETTFLFLNKF